MWGAARLAEQQGWICNGAGGKVKTDAKWLGRSAP